MAEQKGVLTIVSGFSGTGKGTVMKALVASYPEYALSVSATTRKPREGETQGKEYFFLTNEEFERLIAQDGLIEYARYEDNYYGTPRSYVEKQLTEGRDVLLEIEPQGALRVREKYPDTLLIFLTPPSGKELYRRLKERGTESEEEIRSRLARAVEEADFVSDYDYIVVNDEVPRSVGEIHELIQNEHKKTAANQPFIGKLKSQIRDILKGE